MDDLADRRRECGTSSFAFFDVDGTLLQMRSMFAFEGFWLANQDRRGATEPHSVRDQLSEFQASLDSLPREIANRRYYERFAGRNHRAVEHAVWSWYRDLRTRESDYWRTDAVEELRALRQAGSEPVLVSGSFVELLRPFAAELDVRHILATRLVRHGDSYTGEISGPPMIGEGKRRAVTDFIARHGASPAHCHACGDHVSDAPMLESVGHPIVIAGDPALEQLARDRDWRVLARSVTR